MVKNPHRDAQGGDVEGSKKIDVTHGEALEVSNASFDPGYPMDNTLEGGKGNGLNYNKADLVQGYCGYGKASGEER